MKTIWCYIEIAIAKLMNLFIKKDTAPIPDGLYCYKWLGKEKVKMCKYYRFVGKEKHACTYVGFIGWDPCLSDQCKICGENDDILDQ